MRRWLVAVLCVLALLADRVWAASDFMYGGVNCGQTSKMMSLVFRLTADNTEATGILASQVTANYWRQGGSRTSISTTTLANAAVAYSSGGFVEVDSTNMKGLYRLDLPDAAIACGADWVTFNVVRVYGTTTYVYYERLGLASAPDVNVIRWNQTSVAATTVDANLTFLKGTNIAATNVDANLQKWEGSAPNALISGRVDANTQATAAGLTFNLTGNVSGSVGSVTNRVTANTDQWNGTAVIATNASVNVVNWNSSPPNNLIGGRMPIAAQINKNVAYAKFSFLMTDSTTHNPKTGLTTAALGCVRSIDGGAAATGTLANIAETSSGNYTVDFGAADLNGNTIRLTCTANSSDDTNIDLVTWP